MPELPEVETVVRALRRPLIGRTFEDFESLWPRQLVTPPDVDEFKARLIGRTVQGVERRAKYILIKLDGGETLLVHLKMTGHLAVVPGGTTPHPHVRQIFKFADGDELHFRNMRKFGRIYLVNDLDALFAKLGPEPLEEEFTAAVLAERLAGRKRVIKPLLLDQSFVAGIGNIYADEALFDAKIHPQRTADSLNEREIVALHAAIQKVLQLGIEREGASLTTYRKPDGTKGDMQNAMAVFRRTDMPCPDCGEPIRRIVLGQRSTHFCAYCQK